MKKLLYSLCAAIVGASAFVSCNLLNDSLEPEDFIGHWTGGWVDTDGDNGIVNGSADLVISSDRSYVLQHIGREDVGLIKEYHGTIDVDEDKNGSYLIFEGEFSNRMSIIGSVEDGDISLSGAEVAFYYMTRK